MTRIWDTIRSDAAARRVLLALTLGFVVGIIWILGLRFILQRDEHVHYHANFALYVDGRRDPFENFGYYEEVSSCGGDNISNPRTRVHLHKPDNHVVHVHDNGVTWGHFMANLGYGLSNDVLRTDAGVFLDGESGKQLRFMLNGETVPTAANRTIGDKDVLLISYGAEPEAAVREQYETIKADAATFNETTDPAACSGADVLTWRERLQRTLDFSR